MTVSSLFSLLDHSAWGSQLAGCVDTQEVLRGSLGSGELRSPDPCARHLGS